MGSFNTIIVKEVIIKYLFLLNTYNKPSGVVGE